MHGDYDDEVFENCQYRPCFRARTTKSFADFLCGFDFLPKDGPGLDCEEDDDDYIPEPFSWLEPGFSGTLREWQYGVLPPEEKIIMEYFRTFSDCNSILEYLTSIRRNADKQKRSLQRTDPEIVELLQALRKVRSPLAMTLGEYIELKRPKPPELSPRELRSIKLFNRGLDYKPLYRNDYPELKDIEKVRDIPMFFILLYGREYIPKCCGGHNKAVLKMIEFVRADGADIVG